MVFRHPDVYSCKGLTTAFGEDPTRVQSNNGVRGILLESNLAALPEMLAKTGDQMFRLDFKSGQVKGPHRFCGRSDDSSARSVPVARNVLDKDGWP